MNENAPLEGNAAGWLRYAQITLASCAVGYLLLGISLGITELFGLASLPWDGPGMTPGVRPTFAAGLLLGGVLYAGVNGIAAYGLERRAIWAWALTLLLGLAYVPLLCPPIGILLLVAMLNSGVRKAFLG